MLQFTNILLALALAAPEITVETKFVQVSPSIKDGTVRRTPGQHRAAVLLHGIRPHPLSDTSPFRAELSGWEEPKSAMVKTLGRDADVFSFGYSQQWPIEAVAEAPTLANNIASLRSAGYSEIVLVGFSAGAIIARYYVEDHPDCGVTKVIQVCAPNGGSSWGKFTAGVRQSQEPFLRSLSKESRQAAMRERESKRIPQNVEFVCAVSQLGRQGDGMVRCDCQWTRDLQQQGIPALMLRTPHVTAMRSKWVANKLAELMREPQPRWTPAQVEAARIKIMGKEG